MALLALLLGCLASAQDAAGAPAPPLAFALDAEAFAGLPVLQQRGTAFTLVAADGDVDGDPDLLVNWHTFGPTVVLWNDGGRFERGERAWSLPEGPAAPLLDAPKRAMLAAVEAREGPGVYLWHSDWASFWLLAFRGPFAEGAGELVLECNRPILEVAGLEAGEHELEDGRRLRVPLRSALAGRRIFFATREPAVQVKAHVAGAAVPLFLGPELVRHDGPVELWGRDPHGLAWLDVTASPAPEIAVVRGALRGRLVPPLDGKYDDLYVARGGPRPAYERRELPRGYGRGRMTQWVDVDADGRAELYVGNKASPNVLLRFDADFTRAEDVAGALGLAFHGADAFAWIDLDADGDDDLVTLDAGAGFGLARNEGGKRFEALAAAEHGLVLPPSGLASDVEVEDIDVEGEPAQTDAEAPQSPGIDDHDVQLLDFDNDGDLDLLVSGWGRAGACALFAAEGARWAEATERAGLAGVTGTTQVVAADFDADGWLDLLCLGRAPRLLRNERGRFGDVALSPGLRAEARVGTALDADGDGRIDVALAGAALHLARNTSAQRGEWVTLDGERGRLPLGSVACASYADGTRHAVRVGATHRGHLSQGSGPIRLATTAANPLRSLELRFPDGATLTRAIDGPGPVTLAD